MDDRVNIVECRYQFAMAAEICAEYLDIVLPWGIPCCWAND